MATTEIYTLSLHDALPISPVLDDLLTNDPAAYDVVTAGEGPGGALPFTSEQLRASLSSRPGSAVTDPGTV